MTDKTKAVEHYQALASEAAKLADCPPGFYISPGERKASAEPIVYVPYKGATWCVKCYVDPGADYGGRDKMEIAEVKIDDRWFDAYEVLSHYWIDQMQEALDAMPWNDE